MPNLNGSGSSPEQVSPSETSTSGRRDSTGGTTDHLARIRENQRRSRARKREYVSDLETKIRSCHEEGLQLNVKIQRTARRVVEENKKLRELLARVGVDDRLVEDWLRTEDGSDYGSPGSVSRAEEDEILKAKHPCVTCGIAPAKLEKSTSPVAHSAAAMHAPAATAAPAPAPAPLATPLASRPPYVPPYVYPVVPQAHALNAMLNNVPVPSVPVQQNLLPVDFTAYFQSADIDSVPLAQQYYA